MKKLNKLFVLKWLFLLVWSHNVMGQEVQFKDGVYLSHESLQNNQPDYPDGKIWFRKAAQETGPVFGLLTRVKVVGEDLNILPVKKIQVYGKWGEKERIPLQNIWAIVFKGETYVNFNEKFIRLHELGNICFFVEEKNWSAVSQIPTPSASMSMSHPEKLGENIGIGKYRANQYILDWKSGQIHECSKENIERIISKDHLLWQHFIDNTMREQQLYLYVKTYNKRNPLELKN